MDKSLLKKIGIGIGLFALATTTYFLPQIISSNWGKSKLEAHLETLVGGKVSIKELKLSWQGDQSCHHVRWEDKKKGISVEAETLTIAANLIDCLKYKEKPLNVVVEGAKASCKGNLNFIKIYDQTFIDLSFSPIRALIEEGKITFDRTVIDIANSIQVVTWGAFDLEKNRMDMTLGLPPRTLKKLFKTGDLAHDYLLEIPISTKMSTRSLEKKIISYFLRNASVMKSLKK